MRRALGAAGRHRAPKRLLPLTSTRVPQLRRGVRLHKDTDGTMLLLVPEGILRLNDTAAETLALVDGVRSVDAIVDALGARYAAARADLGRDVEDLIERLTLRGYLTS